MMNAFADICISDVTVLSGVRPKGRGNSNSSGRKTSGILYIWNGEACFWSDKKQETKVNAGELVFIPKGCVYKMQYTAPDTTFVLINLELFDKSGEGILISKNISVIARDGQNNRIAWIMSNLEMCGASRNLSAVFRRKELVYKLFGIIFESELSVTSKAGKYPQIFAGVMMLEQSFLENLPISAFADACNISVSQFRTLFNKQYNMSPVQYRNHLRINRAIDILSEGSCTVSEAAYACGFENVGYFCRYYKKITGKTLNQTKHESSR